VKIAPGYKQPVIHVLDASRAVGVVGSLINPALKPAFIQNNIVEQERLRREHQAQRDHKPLLTIETARERRTPIEWRAGTFPGHPSPGLACWIISRWRNWCRSSIGRRFFTPGIARPLSVDT